MKRIFGILFVFVTLLSLNIGFISAAGGLTIPSGTTGGGLTIPAGTTGGSSSNPARIDNPIAADTFDELVANVIEAAVAVLTPLVVVMFIWSGFLFVKAQGNETEITKAKTAITYSFIGAVILLGAEAFAQIIGETVTTITGQ